jgi:hypothetical protein
VRAPASAQEFRRFVARHHPDRGGDPEVFLEGVRAWRDRQAGVASVVFYRKRSVKARLLHRLRILLRRPSRRRGRPTERRLR